MGIFVNDYLLNNIYDIINPILSEVIISNEILFNINDLKYCLNQKKPILFGISIYESFYQYEHIELPKKRDKKIDDVCMILVGYDDEEREWLIKNDKVYRISFKYLLNKKLCKDFWYFEI